MTLLMGLVDGSQQLYNTIPMSSKGESIILKDTEFW